MTNLIRFVTHGGTFGEPNFYSTTRWHRAKCRIMSHYHRGKGRIIDWWNGETYVPLFWRAKGEMRAVRFSAVTEVIDNGNFMLPLDIPNRRDLPHFPTSDACFAHISEAWPHLSP